MHSKRSAASRAQNCRTPRAVGHPSTIESEQTCWRGLGLLRASSRVILCQRHIRSAGGALDCHPETEQPAAERDAADAEPRPAERESSNDVRQPVDVQQDAARGDRNCQTGRSTGEKCACARAATASKQERDCGEECGGGRRMTARERRPEGCGDRIERRSNSMGEVLHGERQEALADEDDDEVRNDPSALRSSQLDDCDDDREHDDRPRCCQVGDEV